MVQYLARLRRPGGELRRGPDHRPGPGLLHRHRLRDRPCWIIRRSAPSAPAGGTTTWRSITPTSSCPASASPSALTRLFYVLGEQGHAEPGAAGARPADVLVLPMSEDMGPGHHRWRPQLRQPGIRAQLYSEQKKFKAKMSYCSTSWAFPLPSCWARTRSPRDRLLRQELGHRRAGQRV